MIKSFASAIVLASALAAPAFAFAQNNAPVTRAEVRAELVQLEKAGYNPAGDQVDYPRNLQAAQARVNAEQGNGATAYGASTAGSAQSGVRGSNAPLSGPKSIYFGN
jgi:hypothetical protein